ncbi:hypothetical protein, partial [Daeguia caeni]|uniref:hypothetical protein n=1 Tax=Daeguia caeni TaxID=439612 RepID=UPI0035BC5B5B
FLMSSAPSQVRQTLHHSEGTSGGQVTMHIVISQFRMENRYPLFLGLGLQPASQADCKRCSLKLDRMITDLIVQYCAI